MYLFTSPHTEPLNYEVGIYVSTLSKNLSFIIFWKYNSNCMKITSYNNV